MGRHQAADGAESHPLVAGALIRRSAREGAHRERAELPGTEGPVGWPDPEPDEDGEPVGWPGGPGPEQSPLEVRSSPQPRPWRRLLGRTSAA
jgi:hypothetical protein